MSTSKWKIQTFYFVRIVNANVIAVHIFNVHSAHSANDFLLNMGGGGLRKRECKHYTFQITIPIYC